MARVRRNLLKLPAGDKTLYWYNLAVDSMLKRPITDPTSWRYQAAVHGYPGVDHDPLAVPGEQLPPASEQQQFWEQCQHGSWFFLPWHRMYLYFFEQIVAAEVQRLGGPADWSLPYWNYCDTSDPNALKLPEPFRSPTLPDGSKNYLYVAARRPDSNEGAQIIKSIDVALKPVLPTPIFSQLPQGGQAQPGFGGTEISSAEHYGPYFYQYCVENQPHNHVHNDVGGSTGWMADPDIAALDPIFWLHHANIDRLWDVWRNVDPTTHLNPTNPTWLNNVTFQFHNMEGQAVTMHAAQVLNTSALGYSYDDVSNPLEPATSDTALGAALPKAEVRMTNSVPPELVGATDSSVEVHGDPVDISIPLTGQSAARRNLTALGGTSNADARSSAPQHRVLLQLENLTASAPTRSYYVYVNVPPGETPDQHPELQAGRLSPFGIAQASRANARHAGSGQTHTLDITEIYHRLVQQAGEDPNSVHVTLVPVHNQSGAPITIGGVKLFFA